MCLYTTSLNRFYPAHARRLQDKSMSRLLLLIPTDLERKLMPDSLWNRLQLIDGVVETCGFGPITAGIRTTQLLARHNPHKVMLVGIAGSYRDRLPVATAACFSRIACYGIGAGSGSRFQSAGELGWPQWVDPQTGHSFGDVIHPVGESLDAESDRMLLSCCSASDGSGDIEDRLRRYPDAAAEDMEAFSVAMACQVASIPLTVIRGISNIAGDRNRANWKVSDALKAAAELAMSRFSL